MRLGIALCIWSCAFLAHGEVTYYRDLAATASSEAGEKYGATKAVDGNDSTRWASRDGAEMPQWIDLRFEAPTVINYLYLKLSVDTLYSPWAEVALQFSSGDPVVYPLAATQDVVSLHFPERSTDFIRIEIRRVHEARHYVGVYTAYGAYDPDESLKVREDAPKPVDESTLTIRGRAIHPSVNLTPEDVVAAKARVESYPWARARRDTIVAEANKWLREDDAYWLSLLPEPGACYAYGFTACPICDGGTGTWQKANCSWEQPGQVVCVNGHSLPDEEHPDAGSGYTAPDGRIHYFKGQFNAWATEQWTQYALPSLTQAWLLTDDTRYADRAMLLLDALASIYKESTSGSWDYPSNPPSGRFARPWYQVARTLVKYVDFYDRLYHAPGMDEPSLRPGVTKRKNIEEYMLLDGAAYCYKKTFAGGLHNGHADYMRGALAVGCVLDIPEYIYNAVEGPFSIRTMLANNIDRDGRYYESSLGYAIHARLLYLTFADPLYNLRNAEYPTGINLYDDPVFRAAFLLPDTQVMLGGRRPNFGDSAPDFSYRAPEPPHANGSDIAFLERLYGRTEDPERRAIYNTLLDWSEASTADATADGESLDWLLWHGRERASTPEKTADLPAPYDRRIAGSWVAGMKGMAMLRAGDQAVLLRYGPSLTHGDFDDLSLQYYAKGYELSYDIGYGLGSTHVQIGWGSSTVSHSLVTVNEKNQMGGEGSGGSLHWFASLPTVQAVSASSEASYSAEGVSAYTRTLALVDGTYLIDAFHVTGGTQHDFAFGSIGTQLDAFGIDSITAQGGSLAEGVDWGRNIGADGDIKGYPNKPYWNPPPGNGYGFFKDIQRGQPTAHWGGEWTIPGEGDVRLRMHVLGDGGEAIIVHAPGLYPSKPDSSYVMARRQGEAPLESDFLAIYEPFTEKPELSAVKRVGAQAVEVLRSDSRTDLILLGSQRAETSIGAVDFTGDLAFLKVQDGAVIHWELQGAEALSINGKAIDLPPGVFEAKVTAIDLAKRSVQLDVPLPTGLSRGLMAVFSNPAYGRTTAYHIASGAGTALTLDAGTLLLGTGRAWEIRDDQTILSDVPHEYARHTGRLSSDFFRGKVIQGKEGGSTRVQSVKSETPMVITVEDATVFSQEEPFDYLDIAPGDHVRIALPEVSTTE